MNDPEQDFKWQCKHIDGTTWHDLNGTISSEVFEYRRVPQETPEPDKFAELKEAYAKGARIQWYSKLTEKWEVVYYPSWCESIGYRIDPEWIAEQDAKLYEWTIGNKDGAWFKAGTMLTEESIVGLFPKSMGFRHVRGQEFVPPKDEQ